MKKTCIRCKIKKEVTKFFKNTTSKDGYNSMCLLCDRSNQVNMISTRAIAKQIIQEEIIKRGNKCKKCNKTFPILCYDWHHRNPKEKKFGIKDNYIKDIKALIKELKKCDLLCANCHRLTYPYIRRK